MSNLKMLLIPAIMVVAGCAQIHGTVIPYENGQYQAISIGGNKHTVLKVAENDAKVTCKKEGKEQYRVISQNVKHNPPPDIDTGNKVVDALGKIAAYREGKKKKDDYEATTVFKCL